MERLEVTRAKELRNDIILRLYSIYPGEMSLVTLRNIMRYKSYTSENDIKKAIYYIEGKGYVTRLLPETGDEWEAVIILTPKGINLAEGDILDVGVLRDE